MANSRIHAALCDNLLPDMTVRCPLHDSTLSVVKTRCQFRHHGARCDNTVPDVTTRCPMRQKFARCKNTVPHANNKLPDATTRPHRSREFPEHHCTRYDIRTAVGACRQSAPIRRSSVGNSHRGRVNDPRSRFLQTITLSGLFRPSPSAFPGHALFRPSASFFSAAFLHLFHVL